MNLRENTILITGAASGIGRGLAEAFHRLGNQVIITGRRQSALNSVAEANHGMRAISLDVANAGHVQEFATCQENGAGRMRDQLQ